MKDALDQTFEELREALRGDNRLLPTHADPFFNFVHNATQTIEVHRRLPRWKAALERDGWKVRTESLSELLWGVVNRSGRWEDWLDDESEWDESNRSVADVLREDDKRALPGLAAQVAELVGDETPNRLLLLTDAGLLHPWFRVRTIETFVHDRVRCPTVVLYPGRRSGQFGLHFLGFYPEDGNYRSTVVGGL